MHAAEANEQQPLPNQQSTQTEQPDEDWLAQHELQTHLEYWEIGCSGVW